MTSFPATLSENTGGWGLQLAVIVLTRFRAPYFNNIVTDVDVFGKRETASKTSASCMMRSCVEVAQLCTTVELVQRGDTGA